MSQVLATTMKFKKKIQKSFIDKWVSLGTYPNESVSWAKISMQEPRSGGKSPGLCAGVRGMAMAKADSCIIGVTREL